MTMPTNAQARKCVPIATGFLDYFPDAVAAVAHLSFVGNEQHNPGKPLFWDRSKSQDEADALMRHFIQRGTLDTDGIRHSAKVAWRALALLQKEIEAETAIEAKEGPFSSEVAALFARDALQAYQRSYPYQARSPEEIEAYIARLNEHYGDEE